MTTYNVLLADGTVGKFDTDSTEGQHPDCFLGEVVRVQLHDENGNKIEVEGKLVETLSEA